MLTNGSFALNFDILIADFFYIYDMLDFIFCYFCWQASVSPVLENIIDRPHKHHSSEKIIPILGVPCDAVSLFIQFLYSSRFIFIIIFILLINGYLFYLILHVFSFGLINLHAYLSRSFLEIQVNIQRPKINKS
jgi:hypothetical protein